MLGEIVMKVLNTKIKKSLLQNAILLPNKVLMDCLRVL